MSDTTQDTPSGTPAAPPPAPTQDWEARFKGLQTTLNEEQRKNREQIALNNKTIAEMTQELQTYRGKLLDADESSKKTQAELEAARQEREKAVQDAATSAKKLNRNTALLQFPNLISLDTQGLLRQDLEGDEFAAYLQNFAKQLGQTEQAGAAAILTGAAPAGGAVRAGALTKEDAMKAVVDAQRKGDMAAYDAAYAELVRLSK